MKREGTITRDEAKKCSEQYRSWLMEIMEEWGEHTIDPEHGGFDTDFGGNWKLRSHEKNIWAQAR